MSMGLVRSSQSLDVAKFFCLLGALAWLLMSEPSLFPNLYLIKSGIKVDQWKQVRVLSIFVWRTMNGLKGRPHKFQYAGFTIQAKVKESQPSRVPNFEEFDFKVGSSSFG